MNVLSFIRVGVRLVTFVLAAASGRIYGESITLERALTMAAQNHPSLQAGAARRQVAASSILTARAYPNPQVGFLMGQQYSQPPGGRRFNVPLFTFAQPLELGNVRPARQELAQRGLESSDAELSAVRLAVFANVRRTFYQALRRDAEIVISQEALRFAEDLRDRIRVRVEVGEVGRLELVRAEAEVATARSVLATARVGRSAAFAAFRAAVGTESATLEPTGTIESNVSLPPLDTLRQQVIDQHPALRFSESEIRRATAQVAYQTALKRPQPQLLLEVDNTNPSYRMGVAVDLPFWNRRAGEIAAAQAGLRETQYLLDARRVQLIAALESAYERLQVSDEEIAALQTGLLLEAQEAVRAAEAAYQLGERGILDVLDAQRVLRTVRLNLVNAQFDRQAAIVEIDELRAVVPGATP